MSKARIYQPDKNAMQSGKGNMKEWIFEFTPERPFIVDELIGWVGNDDTKQQLRLRFATKEAAIAFAEKQRIPYEVCAPNARHQVHKTYADNFAFNKVQ